MAPEAGTTTTTASTGTEGSTATTTKSTTWALAGSGHFQHRVFGVKILVRAGLTEIEIRAFEASEQTKIIIDSHYSDMVFLSKDLLVTIAGNGTLTAITGDMRMDSGVVVGRFRLLRLGFNVDLHDTTRWNLLKGRSEFNVRWKGDAIIVFIDVLKSKLTWLVGGVQLSNRWFQCSVDIGVRWNIDLSRRFV